MHRSWSSLFKKFTQAFCLSYFYGIITSVPYICLGKEHPTKCIPFWRRDEKTAGLSRVVYGDWRSWLARAVWDREVEVSSP
jgi:hypothetical protein